MKNGKEDEHTPSFIALRRKKALHGIHVGTVKLIPTAAAPHTKHGPRFLVFIIIGSMYNVHRHALIVIIYSR